MPTDSKLTPIQPTPSRTRFRFDNRVRYNASNISVNDYSPQELNHLSTPAKFFFATLPSTNHHNTNPIISDLYQPVTFNQLLSPKKSSSLHSLQALRCNNTFSSFNIYPTTPTSLQANNLLWHVVHTGTYDPTEADPLLGAHVFVLGLAPELHQFLAKVSLPDMHRAIIDFLVLLHHQLTTDGDDDGLAKLQDDLIPEVWDELYANIGVFPTGEPTEPHRAKVLENLVQISFMTPWRVDVFAAYLTADDVTALVDVLHSPTANCSSPRRYMLPNDDRKGTEVARGRAMLKLYQDWRVFAAALREGMGLEYDLVTEAMERAVHAGKSGGLFEQAFTALEASRSKDNLFSQLPSDVLERKIVPWIIRRGCEAIAPRRRRLASLKSLLELSSQYLEDLQAVEDLAANMDAATSEIVTGLLDQVDYGGDDTQNGEEVTTSDRVGLGIVTNRVLAGGEFEESGDLTEALEEREISHPRWVQDIAIADSIRTGTESSVVHLPPYISPRFSVESAWIYPLDNAPWENATELTTGEHDSDEERSDRSSVDHTSETSSEDSSNNAWRGDSSNDDGDHAPIFAESP